MSLLFVDGFDHTADYFVKWSYNPAISWANPSTSYGRRTGSKGGYISNGTYAGKSLINTDPTWIAGMSFRIISLPNGTYIDLFNFVDLSANSHIRLVLTYEAPYYKFKIYSGQSTLLNTVNIDQSFVNLVGWGTWNYVEFKSLIDSSVGTYEVRVNEISCLSGSGANTKHASGSNSYANIIAIGTNSNGPALYIDDFYLCNGNGSIRNNFLGDTRIDAQAPNAAGNYTQWTPSSGSNYQCVDENPNVETDYVSTGTADNRDSYNYTNLPTETPTLDNFFAVTQNFIAKRDTTGATTKINPFCRIDGVDYDSGFDIILNDSWVNYQYTWELNPATGVAWTKSDIDGAEFGAKASFS